MIIPNPLRNAITCAITDRSHYGSAEPDREAGLLHQAVHLAQNGIKYIQLREKDLAPRDLLRLARKVLETLRNAHSETRLLLNAGPNCRADIAVAAGAQGLHLTSSEGQLTPTQARVAFGSVEAIISVSCHTLEDVHRARDNAADIILFGPVFGKFIAERLVVPGTGLDLLANACVIAGDTPVLALGGITLENAPTCIDAGAKGIAAIRLFQQLAG